MALSSLTPCCRCCNDFWISRSVVVSSCQEVSSTGKGTNCTDSGSCFVQHENRRVFEHHARYRHALLLAARQPDAALADLGLISIREREDAVVDLSVPCCLLNVFNRRTRSRVRDVCQPMSLLSSCRMAALYAISSFIRTQSCGTTPIEPRRDFCVAFRMSTPSTVMLPSVTS
jgi:hypothetical protein